MITQIELIDGIARVLKRHGHGSLNARQLNAVVDAANVILAQLARPHQPAAPGMGLQAWLSCDETGMSSKYLAFALGKACGRRAPYVPNNHPHDADDFGRCVGLLRAAPELRAHLGALAQGHGPVWAALAAVWPELEAIYEREAPSGVCPELDARIGALVRQSET